MSAALCNVAQRFVPHTGTAPLWGGKVNGNAPFSPLIPQNVTSNSSDNQEVKNWKSQNATSKSAKMGWYLPSCLF